MPDETTFELASVHFGAEPVAVFRFGYERFELRARLGPGNLAGCGKSRFRDQVIQDIWYEYWVVALLIGQEKPTRAFFRSLLEHAIASAAEVAASVFATWSHE